MPPLSPFSKSCLALAIAQTLSVSTGHAASIEVNTIGDMSADDGNCTLREAIETVNAGDADMTDCIATGDDVLGTNDIIIFNSTVAGSTITLNGSQLGITKDVSINPGGSNTTLDAAGLSGVMRISGAEVTLDHLRLINGINPVHGGGIFADNNSTVTLSNSTVLDNSAPNGGGGIFIHTSTLALSNSTVSGSNAYAGGGIYANNSPVTLSNSTVSGNSAPNGGGIDARGSSIVTLNDSTVSGNSASNGSGINVDNSPLTLSNSTVSDNSANFNGGGIRAKSSTVTLSNSTVSGNSAGNVGGGIFANTSSSVTLSNSTVSGNSARDSGGINVYNSPLTLSNSTVSDNSANFNGGGIRARSSTVTLSNSTVSGNSAGNVGGGIYADNNSPVTLSNSTVSGNSASFGGGISAKSSTVTLSNSIVANSLGGADCESIFATIIAGTDSISSDTSCGATTMADPLLGPLDDNGGPTLTHALLAGSPAINAGTGADATRQDQRGLDLVGVRDIGAFELQQLLQLTLSPASISENGGVAQGTVSRNTPTDEALAVTLNSSDTGSAEVPPMVTIPADAMSVTFPINAIDDLIVDGDSISTISASATGLGVAVTADLAVTDDDDPDGDNIASIDDNCPVNANPNQADFEGDGIGDACDLDIDGDGLPNSYETANGLNPFNSLDRDADPDGDGFTNLQEYQFGSDPQVADTDENNNGIPDAVEDKKVNLAPIIMLLLDEEDNP